MNITEGVRFDTLGLSEEVLRALEKKGITESTPVQAGCMPAKIWPARPSFWMCFIPRITICSLNLVSKVPAGSMMKPSTPILSTPEAGANR